MSHAKGMSPDPAPEPSAPEEFLLAGTAVLDLGRSDRAVVQDLEPMVDVRAAAEWGGLMDGTIAIRDDGVVWVPGDHARRFGFIEFRLAPDEVVDIRVQARPSLRGAVDIDLTDNRHVVVRVPDPDRWQSELDRMIGG